MDKKGMKKACDMAKKDKKAVVKEVVKITKMAVPKLKKAK